MPESGEQGIDQPPGGAFPDDGPQQKAEKSPGPQVGFTDIEHEIQPGWEDGSHQKQIRGNGMAAAGGCQEAVPQAQHRPQQQADEKPPGGSDRFRHPKNRRQPPARGSS